MYFKINNNVFLLNTVNTWKEPSGDETRVILDVYKLTIMCHYDNANFIQFIIELYPSSLHVWLISFYSFYLMLTFSKSIGVYFKTHLLGNDLIVYIQSTFQHDTHIRTYTRTHLHTPLHRHIWACICLYLRAY